nr:MULTISPECIES: PAS domain-containing methyl-accepting chemotaxis protein [unclassified Dyella]
MNQLWNRLAPRRDPSHSLSDLQGQIAALHRAQAIIEFDLAGNILDANDNFLRTMGYARDDVVGQHHRMFVTPEERDGVAYRDFWQRLGQGEHYTGQFERIAEDGRRVWIQGSYSPILDAAGRPRKVIKHATDVTQLRLQSADMEGRLAAIDRAQAVISFDLDGVILEANDNFLATMGYAREEVTGRHHRMFVEPRERESEEYARFWQRLRRGEYNAGLYRRVRKDGSEAWIQATYNPIFDMAGKPFKIVKYATDVTQQTVAMNMLQSALGSLAETVPAIAGDAQNANRLAHDASSSASSGGSMVDRLVDTIGEIDRRAQNMAEIIGVMDSIAFQTTILAINAAVEAAHAGEQGRGFGVVAQEVRALSQRSAQSAKEIRELVQNTIESLGEGSERARQAGAAMHAIVDSAGQVNARVGQIADAAHAQAAGLVQVRQAIEQLRQRA